MTSKIIKNKIGEEILYEIIDTNKIRISSNKIKTYRSIDKNGNFIMFDFDGGPVLTKGGFLKIDNIEYKVDKIEEMESQYDNMIELMVYIK